jgi:hypothetical protein
MRVQQHFKNVFTYSEVVDTWVKNAYKSVCGREISYAFAYDFAICDFLGDKAEAKNTYKNCVNNNKEDYKAMTELYVCLMYLAYAESQLTDQGFEDREEWGVLFQNLAEKVYDKFYQLFKGNKEACQHFFDWTD